MHTALHEKDALLDGPDFKDLPAVLVIDEPK